MFFIVMVTHNLTLFDVFAHRDAIQYKSISINGYTNDHEVAFYPLYPLIIKIISFNYFDPIFIGTAFSGLIYILLIVRFCASLNLGHKNSVAINNEKLRYFIAPQNNLGMLMFILAPCSYIFFTNWSESLFLILSYLSFYYAINKKFILAAISIGLVTVTRNQGMFVALIALIIIFQDIFKNNNYQTKKLLFIIILVSIPYACWLFFLHYRFNDMFAFFHAQNYWHKVSSFKDYFKTFLFMNPWQNIRINSILHELWFILLGYFLIIALVRRYYLLSVYGLLSIFIIPMQGELVTDYRFTTVLFPIYFFIGKYLEDKYKKKAYLVLIPLGLINILITYAYSIGKWAS